MRNKRMISAIAAMAVLAAPATAQLLGGGGGLGGLGGALPGGLSNAPDVVAGAASGVSSSLPTVGGQGGVVNGLEGPLMGFGAAIDGLTSSNLLSLRRERLRTFVRQNRETLDIDDAGNPIRRDVVIGIGLSADQIERAKAAGFAVLGGDVIDGIDLITTILTPPRGKPARKAIEMLQAADPQGAYTLDHIYEPARAPLRPMKGEAAAGGAAASTGPRIGLIDGGIGSHPAFANATIQQRGFAGEARPSGHGTAVASLIVGNSGAFHGAAIGALLMAADVYGGSPANGSADAIVRAMGWLAQGGAKVINISLVGPPNPLLAAGIRSLQQQGIVVVAAVGNDGPASPPQYPASYPGVVAVTAVDAKGKALFEAGKPLHLDFAAPGADMVGAVPGGKWERLRGTSFAAPFVAARIAMRGSVAALGSETRVGTGRIGRGIICAGCGNSPGAVGLK